METTPVASFRSGRQKAVFCEAAAAAEGFTRLELHRSRTSHIEPGAPWRNPSVESHNGHLRRELLDLELLDSVLKAQVLIDDWWEEYNTYRPHQSLGYLTPEFARRWRTENEVRVSQ